MSEKERAEQEAEAIHQANVSKAEAEAARIAEAQGLMTDSTQAIERFASVQPKAPAVQSVAQVAKTSRLKQKAAKLVEEEEDRDDFEGFGSITAMAQHKDDLVDKTLEDPAFKAQLAAEEQAKVDAVTSAKAAVKAKADAKVKAVKDAENAKKVKLDKFASAKAKLAAALNKPEKKVEPVRVAPKLTTQEMTQQLETEGVSSTVYAKALESILGKPKVEASSLAKTQIVEQASVLDDNGDPVGFIHQHMNHIENLEQEAAKQTAVLNAPKKSDVNYSKDAPKGKGILARIQEQEQKEREKQEDREKDALMAEALADPAFSR